MAIATTPRKFIAPNDLGGGWSYDAFTDGRVSLVKGNLEVRFTGDFTVFEFLSGTADSMRLLQDGKVMYRISDLSVGNAELGQFESNLGTSLFAALEGLIPMADTFQGGERNDLIYSHGGADTVFGGDGNDEAYGGDGNDRMYGGAGKDTFDGDLGRDRIWGGRGNDTLDGDDGNDKLYGGKGRDYVEGDEGNDLLFGGQGADTFNFDLGDGHNVVRDFGRGNDVLEFDLFNPPFGYTARDFVNDFSRKANGNTHIEAEGFSVELRGFTTTKADLASMIELEIVYFG